MWGWGPAAVVEASASIRPVLIVSASSERNVAEDIVAQGATDYLLKPFDPGQLQAKVEEALEARR